MYLFILITGSATFIDDNRKLIMCVVSKSGCTTWTTLWIHANIYKGQNLTSIPFKYKGTAVHAANNYKPYGMKRIKSSNFPQGYNDYTKFIVVRNPFDRLVSAYYNLIYWKLGVGDAGPEIVPFFREEYPHLHSNLSDLSFEEFIKSITDPSSHIFDNKHWRPYSETCQPCDIEYDYIIRTETMSHYPENDALPILSLLGYDSSMVRKTHMNSFSRKDKQLQLTLYSKHLELFQSLPAKLLKHVFKRYRMDMALFGYSFNDSFIADCKIDNGEHLCC